MTEIPVGMRENSCLEFKAAEAAENPLQIVREVVGMLNAQGGEIWIGMKEDSDGRGVMEGLQNTELARRRILDCMVETIEPSVGESEVCIVEVHSLLHIVVTPEESHRPYALIRGAQREFPKRHADRLRPMTREELFHQVRSATTGTEEARHRLEERREELIQQNHPGEGSLWIRIEPEVELDLIEELTDRNIDTPGHLIRYLIDASLSGNRESGWTCIMPYGDISHRHDRLLCGDEGYLETSLYHTGALESLAPLASLYWKGPEKEIWPLTLLELPTSVFRLAAALLREHPLFSAVHYLQSEIGVFGLKGWKLRGGSPGNFTFRRDPPRVYEEQDLIMAKPLRFTREEITNQPDRCAFTHIKMLYNRFGLPEKAVPAEYDRDLGQLRLP